MLTFSQETNRGRGLSQMRKILLLLILKHKIRFFILIYPERLHDCDYILVSKRLKNATIICMYSTLPYRLRVQKWALGGSAYIQKGISKNLRISAFYLRLACVAAVACKLKPGLYRVYVYTCGCSAGLPLLLCIRSGYLLEGFWRVEVYQQKLGYETSGYYITKWHYKSCN